MSYLTTNIFKAAATQPTHAGDDKDNTIAQLLKELALSNRRQREDKAASDFEVGQLRAEVGRLKEEVADLREESGDQKPLAKLGEYVRSRRMVYGETNGDPVLRRAIIERGDSVAHRGYAVEDALIIKSCSQERVLRESGFLEFYGFKSTLVLRLRHCLRFIQILDWRGSMVEFMFNISVRWTLQRAFTEVFENSPLANYVKDSESQDPIDIDDIERFLESNVAALAAYDLMAQEYSYHLELSRNHYRTINQSRRNASQGMESNKKRKFDTN
ncbi:uncharacterized protein LY89DRAFT_737960 [Mollisia scopiformis]|uniref:Uncharacterized protein n=1 Tax=Mollisia scopiformis TaxID=149040 RepID=A0A194WYP1_MOLSC|nr:uncharacterized protein LY89DRAFT_737960 [Mollisia scopiformis]KUJ13065.1 hypothetical protein LY89DRAFT_737960 [Mollisia scopiformis]